MTKPTLIQGGFYQDQRGSIAFVNDFKFSNIERFYIVCNSVENPLRAWQGHKLDEKNFYCIEGSFKISCVKIDDWQNPSPNLTPQVFILKATEPAVLHIPAGYANAVLSLSENAKLISFSTLPLTQVKEDDVRFAPSTWNANL